MEGEGSGAKRHFSCGKKAFRFASGARQSPWPLLSNAELLGDLAARLASLGAVAT